jgi:gliding motility-associated-like protein
MNLTVKNCFLFFIFCAASFHLSAQSVGGTTSGGAMYCNSNGSGFITLVGNTGTYYWEASTDGTTWIATGSSNTGQSYNNLTQTTCYRAIVQSGSFPPDTSTVSCVTVYLPSVGGAVSGGGAFCVTTGSGTLNLSGNNGNVLSWMSSTDNGSSWSSISNTTTTLNYSNITQNTIYSAVVQNGPGCPVDTSSSASFTIDAVTIAGIVSGSDSVCYGSNSGTLDLSGTTGSIITWISSTDNGNTWALIPNVTASQNYSNLISSTRFTALVQNGTCPADTSDYAEIRIISLPVVNAGTDTTIIQGHSVTLNGIGGGNPVWTPAAGLSSYTVFSPVATPASTTNYTLTVTDMHGCINDDDVVVTVLPPVFNGIVSNLFTPNGDGINDTWYIQDIENFPGSEVFVYNIYGNEVYSKKSYNNDWKGIYDGSALPDGTYYYVLKFKDSDKIIKGSVDIYSGK